MKKTARDRERTSIELPGNRYVYDGGVLSNKRTDTVIARGVKNLGGDSIPGGA